MIKFQRIKIIENDVVIYHYLYGDLLSSLVDYMNVWTDEEVKKKVFDARKIYTTYDYRVIQDKQEIAICSIRDIDMESRNANLYITMCKPIEHDEDIINEIIKRMIDFAFGQLDLIRLEGFIVEDSQFEKKKDILEINKFKQEARLNDVCFLRGYKRNKVIFGLIKEESVVESVLRRN